MHAYILIIFDNLKECFFELCGLGLKPSNFMRVGSHDLATWIRYLGSTHVGENTPLRNIEGRSRAVVLLIFHFVSSSII